MPVLSVAAQALRRLPAGRTKVRAGRALAQAAIALGAAPIVRTTMLDGSVLELDARSRTEAAAIWQGAYEPEYRDALIALLGGNGVYYDVGANVGLLTVPVARSLRGRGRTVCFEPVERNAASLARNIELNELTDCSVHRVALGAEQGEAQIELDTGFGAATGNAVLSSATQLPSAYREVETIRIARLDDLVHDAGLPAPDVVKLDVEGSEVGFLRGAAVTLAASRPVILGEFNSQLMPNFGMTFLDAATALPPDYAIFSFAASGRIEQKEPSIGLGDVLLVPDEQIARMSEIWTVSELR